MIQKKMFNDFNSRNLFEKAMSYGMDYKEKTFDRNIFPTEEAIENLSEFEESLPADSGDAEDILDLLHRCGSPATVSQLGGRYYGFVMGSSVPIGLAVKYLTDIWDQNPLMYIASPVCSKLEEIVNSWLVDLFDLPENTVAGFVSGSSMAILCAIVAARWRIYQNIGYDVNAKGLAGALPIRIVAGAEVHSTVVRAVAVLGLGVDNVEFVEVDGQGRMNPEKLPDLDNRTILLLQAGNLLSGAFDDFETLCRKGREAGAWIHIDGAFGLWAHASEKLKHLTSGIELADSWSVDGHKTLNTPYDCGVVLCRDEEALVSSLQNRASYINYGRERDNILYTPEMSRRNRVAEIWAVMKYLGRDGIDEMVTDLWERAVQFAGEISEIEGFTVMNDVVFNQVALCCDTDALTEGTLAKVQEYRECWVGGAEWKGRKVIRVSVCSWATTSEDIHRSVLSFKKALEDTSKI